MKLSSIFIALATVCCHALCRDLNEEVAFVKKTILQHGLTPIDTNFLNSLDATSLQIRGKSLGLYSLSKNKRVLDVNKVLKQYTKRIKHQSSSDTHVSWVALNAVRTTRQDGLDINDFSKELDYFINNAGSDEGSQDECYLRVPKKSKWHKTSDSYNRQAIQQALSNAHMTSCNETVCGYIREDFQSSQVRQANFVFGINFDAVHDVDCTHMVVVAAGST